MGSDKNVAGSGPRKTHGPCRPDWEIKRPEPCSNTLVHGGRTLHFCSRRCKKRFERNPGKYIAVTT
jgi:hypothetical protein